MNERDPREPEVKFHCPVCGYQGLWQPAYDRLPLPPFPDFGDPPYTESLGYYSHGCCDCCGYEYGFDDDANACAKPTSFKDWREEWLRNGSPWFSTNRPQPAGWTLERQLKAAGLK